MLEQIKEALEKATRGPWKVYEENGENLIGTAWEHGQLKEPAPVVSSSVHVKHGHQVYISKNNANLIANTPEYFRYLIGEVEWLEKDYSIGVEDRVNIMFKNDELQKALEWYADGSNWGSIEDQGLYISDGGERARTALQSIQGGDNT